MVELGEEEFGEKMRGIMLPLPSYRFRGRPGLSRVLLLLLMLVLAGVIVSGCTGVGAQARGWSGVVVAEDRLFFGSMDGELVALSASSGMPQWSPFTPEVAKSGVGFGCAPASVSVAIYGTPVVAGDLVYFGGYNGKVYAINSSSGALRWVYPREDNISPIVGGLVVEGGRVFGAASDGKIYALDAETGDLRWDFQADGKIWATPVVVGEALYVGSLDKKLYALNAADGGQKWQPFEVDGAIVATPLVYKNTVYFGSVDRHMYAVNADNGTLKWRSALEAGNWFWARPVVANGTIYAGNLDGKVYALNAETGDVVTDFDLGSSVASSPVLVDNSVIVATKEGRLFSIDAGSNRIRQLADVAALTDKELDIHSPLSAEQGKVYVHAQTEKYGSLLYALDAATGAGAWRYP